MWLRQSSLVSFVMASPKVEINPSKIVVKVVKQEEYNTNVQIRLSLTVCIFLFGCFLILLWLIVNHRSIFFIQI